MLRAWIERHGRNDRVQAMEARQAILRYGDDPAKSLAYLRERLDVRLDHQREVAGEPLKLPVALDPALVSRESFVKRAFEKHPKTLDGFEGRAIEALAGANLDPDLRRVLLGRLERPDVPGLVELVAADLGHKNSRRFGSLGIHMALLLSQLEDLQKLKPELLDQRAFVDAVVVRLRPGADTDWREDPAERGAYLARVWSFVEKLGPAHNSLKVQVLYHRLVHERSLGNYPKELFLAYPKLPRNVPYASELLKREEYRRAAADLSADTQPVTMLRPVVSDEPLVRDYLAHYFLTEDDERPYAKYLDESYVKEVLAETKILNGLGDMERWASLLPPERFGALKERVDLDFAPTNKPRFDAGENVSLDVHVKNVSKLIVKVFELNLLNYYRANGREADTSIDLDGLVPNEEQTFDYPEPPLRRVKRHFEFPALSGRGTYVVDFIGGGRSSRVIVRKGDLRFLSRTSAAGQSLTILDESNRKVPDGVVWFGGREYRADDSGTVLIPFTNDPGRRPLILVQGRFAALKTLDHEAEGYALSVGFHVERESLIARSRARVLVRPYLTLNGEPVSLSLLESPTLVIRTVDLEGIPSSKELPGFVIGGDRESVHERSTPSGADARTHSIP
ncbi:MAG: hypothetical protein QUU85_13720, partial [Candidatus Eisenbacteria bacterium]|nr:hypothetical protein [Candidatus Eisenbacteria bacterium]